MQCWFGVESFVSVTCWPADDRRWVPSVLPRFSFAADQNKQKAHTADIYFPSIPIRYSFYRRDISVCYCDTFSSLPFRLLGLPVSMCAREMMRLSVRGCRLWNSKPLDLLTFGWVNKSVSPQIPHLSSTTTALYLMTQLLAAPDWCSSPARQELPTKALQRHSNFAWRDCCGGRQFHPVFQHLRQPALPQQQHLKGSPLA